MRFSGNFPSVDTPEDAIVNSGIGGSRMLPSVRPICAALCRWPVWEFANRIHITHACSEALWKGLVFRLRLADCGAIPSFGLLPLPTTSGPPQLTLLPRPEPCNPHPSSEPPR
jgi:hypothetical protein